MPDVGIKISELPVALGANLTDQLETNQAGTSRSVTVAQVVRAVVGTIDPAVQVWLNQPTSANLAAAVPDATGTSGGSGALVFSFGPALTGPQINGASLTGPVTGNPNFTGQPSFNNALATTQPPGTNNTTLATTQFVQTALGAGSPPTGTAGGDLTGSYPNPTIKASVNLSGTPTCATIIGTGTDLRIVNASSLSSQLGLILPNYAPINSPSFTGTPTTQNSPVPGDNTTKLATTAYVLYELQTGSAAGGGPYLSRLGGTMSGPLQLAPAATPPPSDNSNLVPTTAWVRANAGGGASIWVGTTPPASPTAGALWWYTDASTGGGTLYIFYIDASGPPGQWVPAAAAAGSSGFPPGMVTDFAGSVAPAGWLMCDGTSYPTATYPALFAAIAYTYGGSGANFNVPDLRGRVTAMADSGSGRLPGFSLGVAGGEAAHTLNVAELPSHTHHCAGDMWLNAGGAGSHWTDFAFGGGAGGNVYYYNYVDYTGSGSGHNNVQPTIAMNKIIKT